MHIALLGPLDIRLGGHDIRISSHHQRALVAALASEAGKVISAERLIDTVWADRPPATARTKLQGYVSATRRMLGRAEPGGLVPGWPILTRDPGYLLSADGVTIDLFEYRRLLRLASGELDIGQVSVAWHHLDQALGLWRGSAFADASTPMLARLAGALERGRLLAVERKAECALRLGHYDAVAEELTLFVAANPLREGMRATLMMALYRRGCRAEALECYRSGRGVLRDELGIEPGTQLRRLHELMLCDDPELNTQTSLGRVIQAALPGSEAPSLAGAVAGEGEGNGDPAAIRLITGRFRAPVPLPHAPVVSARGATQANVKSVSASCARTGVPCKAAARSALPRLGGWARSESARRDGRTGR